MRLFRIGSTWYADIKTGADRIRRSTRCTDKKAPEAVARQWERDAADPDHTTTAQATLNDALSLLITDRQEQAAAGRKSASTVSFYKSKAGHWLRSGIWKGDVASIFPVAFSPEYKPRERALSYEEARDLLAELTSDRAARVAFILATSKTSTKITPACSSAGPSAPHATAWCRS